MFSNSFGNNILVLSQSGTLTYYLLTTEAAVTRSVEIEADDASLPCITGTTDKTYIVYSHANTVKIKYTTNGGLNWIPISDRIFNSFSLDATYTDRLHVAYEYNNCIKYRQYTTDGWSNQVDVSSSETGTEPRIQPLYNSSNHKIYIVYQNGNNCKSRELNVATGNWDALRSSYTNLGDEPWHKGFGVDNNYIYNYRVQSTYDWTFHHDVYYSTVQTIRKSDYVQVSSEAYFGINTGIITSTNTYDNKTHTAFAQYHIVGDDGGGEGGSGEVPDGVIHSSFGNGTGNLVNIFSGSIASYINISSTYNDLHVVWKESDYLSYAHCNAAPSAPSNLVLSNYGWHPRLNWIKSSDPDIDHYRIYRNYGGYLPLYETNYCLFLDNTISINPGPQAGTEVYYKVTAIDKDGAESIYSNEVNCEVPGEDIEKKGSNENNVIKEYKLLQNYPNPFNPSTSISYELPEAGVVQLKIFNLLGSEVKMLVDEFKQEGAYSINFDASDLPSGVYIYSIKVNSFVQNHKMTLMK